MSAAVDGIDDGAADDTSGDPPPPNLSSDKPRSSSSSSSSSSGSGSDSSIASIDIPGSPVREPILPQEVANVEQPKEVSPNGRWRRFDTLYGTGAFKRVYMALDSVTGRQVAWNDVLLYKLNEDQRKIALDETTLLAQLRHPNIIQILDDPWCSPDGRHMCFITEKCDDNLEVQVSRMHPIGMDLVRRYSKEILSALHYLHSQDPPIIHRDIKGMNVLVSTGGELKVADFGLSISRFESHTLTGSVGYLAPEMFEEKYTTLVDIWAFGILVLEMVTSKMAYHNVRNNNLRYLTDIGPRGVPPPELVDVKDPSLRAFISLCLQGQELRPTARQLLDQKVFDLNWEHTEDTSQDGSETLQPSEQPHEDDGSGADQESEKEQKRWSIEVVVCKTDNIGVVHLLVTITFEGRPPVPVNICDYPFSSHQKLAVAHRVVKQIGSEGPSELDLEIEAVIKLDVADAIEEAIKEPYEGWQKHVSVEEELKKAEAENKRTQRNRLRGQEFRVLFESLTIDEQYVQNFVDQQVSVEDLPLLSPRDLEQLLTPIGPRRRLEAHIEKIKHTETAPPETLEVHATPPGSGSSSYFQRVMQKGSSIFSKRKN